MEKLLIIFLLVWVVTVLGASLLYKFLKWMNRPSSTRGVNAVIPVYTNSNNIEQLVRYYSIGNDVEKIILLNLGASPDTERICKLLTKQNDFVYFCSTFGEIGSALENTPR